MMEENSTLEDMAETGGKMLRDTYEKTNEYTDEVTHKLQQQVQERPLLMLIGALAIGAILSRMMRSS